MYANIVVTLIWVYKEICDTEFAYTFEIWTRGKSFHSVVKSVSITRIFVVLLTFTLMGLISGYYHMLFNHFKDSNVA